MEDSGYTGCALRSGQEAAEHNKEHNLDLCPSQIVGLAGQWSGPQSIYTFIYLGSETKQKKILGHRLGEATKPDLSPDSNKMFKPELDGQV